MQHAAAEESRASGLSAEQVQAMRRYVDFESHIRFHPIPTRCDDAECREELLGSKKEIEEMLGRTRHHFAYYLRYLRQGGGFAGRKPQL
ncbi:hypothetical protein FSB08_32445 [Paraburkholderia sp. JPY432]|uniref:hypothetical protein n=1 Tax=Paraburkholderia youngii TaxID=2782701 RepID=UPI001594E9B5|nr:hypothetical protein [Paraburkholderia youngii]NVH77101.1 hypothetical protein [Paraburkholderia youngii]